MTLFTGRCQRVRVLSQETIGSCVDDYLATVVGVHLVSRYTSHAHSLCIELLACEIDHPNDFASIFASLNTFPSDESIPILALRALVHIFTFHASSRALKAFTFRYEGLFWTSTQAVRVIQVEIGRAFQTLEGGQAVVTVGWAGKTRVRGGVRGLAECCGWTVPKTLASKQQIGRGTRATGVLRCALVAAFLTAFTIAAFIIVPFCTFLYTSSILVQGQSLLALPTTHSGLTFVA